MASKRAELLTEISRAYVSSLGDLEGITVKLIGLY